jgi:hypothetical protein
LGRDEAKLLAGVSPEHRHARADRGWVDEQVRIGAVVPDAATTVTNRVALDRQRTTNSSRAGQIQ